MSLGMLNPFTFVVGIFVYIIFLFLVTLVLHFMMPKQLLELYFKPPHFGEFECQIFSGIPYSPMRTIMFMTVFAFPGQGEKRKLTKAYLLVPKWYRVISKVVLVSFLIIAIVIASAVSIYYAYQAYQLFAG